MKRTIFLIIFSFLVTGLKAQTKLDSLLNIWQDKSNADTTRVQALHHYTWEGFVALEKPDSGIYFAQMEYDFAVKTKNKKFEGLALNNLGLCYKHKKEFEQAEKYFLESFEIQKSIKYAAGIGYSLYNLGDIYKSKGDFIRAAEYWRLHLYYLDLYSKDEDLVASSFRWLNNLYKNEIHIDSAKALTNSYIAKWKKAKRHKLLSRAYIEAAEYYRYTNFSKSVNLFNLAITSAKIINDSNLISKAAIRLGDMYCDNGLFPNSLSAYRLAEPYTSSNTFYKLSYLYSGMGSIFEETKEFKKALYYYTKGLVLDEQKEDAYMLGYSYMIVGTTYALLNDNENALINLNKAQEVYGKRNKSFGIVLCNRGLGLVHENLGQHKKALSFFKQMLPLEKKDDYTALYEADLYAKLGTSYLLNNDYKNGLKYCLTGLKLAQERKNYVHQESNCDCLYKTYSSTNNNTKALQYLQELTRIKDTISSRESSKKIQNDEYLRQIKKDSIATADEARLVQEAYQEELSKKNRTRNILIGSSLVLLVLGGGIYSQLRYVRKSKAIIEEEKDRSNNLLLNILPADIAEELKIHGKAEARDFDIVSILFTDFKGFTAASEKLSAADLVKEINTCFEAFDHIMGKYKIEKIKTIGDAYMAAGGLPVPTDDSIKNTVLAALEMQDFIGKRKAEMDEAEKPAFEMRVGIHTGPVVAGIVGVKKFQYDIWGDAVNTASRMESNGQVGKVNISQSTYNLLKDDANFAFETRGKIEAKGKGEIEMYFVSKA